MTTPLPENGGMLGTKAEIAERLTRTRAALKKNQAQVCKDLRIAANRWNQYESGERRITLDVAAKMVARYRVTLDWIYLGDPSGLPGTITKHLPEPTPLAFEPAE